MRTIQRLVENLPANEVVLYLDEVDIHLNPKIGPDWTKRGRQKKVLTPGCNEKRYLAGAWNPKTRRLIYVEGERKTSLLFLELLYTLVTKTYPNAKRIHIILDNYGIHDSLQVRLALKSAAAAKLEAPLLAAILPGSQSDRTHLEGPARQRHPQPPVRDDGRTHGRSAELPRGPKPPWSSHLRTNGSRIARRVPTFGKSIEATELVVDALCETHGTMAIIANAEMPSSVLAARQIAEDIWCAIGAIHGWRGHRRLSMGRHCQEDAPKNWPRSRGVWH